MAAFSDEEKRILANILPGVAAALRSPLNNLHMAAQRLTQGQKGDSAESAIMRQSYYRMLRLVSNLAMGPELLSDKPFQTQNEELVVLLDELCRQADSIAREAGVEVRFDCRERYVVAAVERTYLERLVWNLLSNALKFTPRGGVITVSLEVRSGQVLLRVRDTGCGIPAERMATLFDRWAEGLEAAPAAYGMGLGLPICRRIAPAAGEPGGSGYAGDGGAAPRPQGRRTGAGHRVRLCGRVLPRDDGAERRAALSGLRGEAHGLKMKILLDPGGSRGYTFY